MAFELSFERLIRYDDYIGQSLLRELWGDEATR